RVLFVSEVASERLYFPLKRPLVALVKARMLRHRFTAVFAAGSAAKGAILLLVNLSGFFLPLRSPHVNGYRDFAGAETLEFREAMRRLDEIAERNLPLVELVSEATRVFHEGIAHIAPADVAKNG